MSVNMSSNFFFVLATLALFMVSSIYGHSQMRCAKYDMATGNCLAPIRSSGVSFMEEGNDMLSGGGVCQVPMANPISSAYGNGANCGYAPCDLPMGTIRQGETFTIMWIARNHAVADQNPGNISLYISPVESQNQGVDVSTAVFAQNKFCEAPFMSCNGQNGNMVQCYTTCTLPVNTPVGIHTLWWKWQWDQSVRKAYTTCADITVSASASSGSTPSTPVTVPSTPVSIPIPVTVPAPVTIPSPVPVSTPVSVPSPIPASTPVSAPSTPSTTTTTGAKATPAPVPVPVPVSIPKPVPAPVSVPAPVPTPSTPTSGCNLGDQICVGGSQYQTCTNGRDANYWAAPQNCNVATTCQKSKNPAAPNKIYCM